MRLKVRKSQVLSWNGRERWWTFVVERSVYGCHQPKLIGEVVKRICRRIACRICRTHLSRLWSDRLCQRRWLFRLSGIIQVVCGHFVWKSRIIGWSQFVHNFTTLFLSFNRLDLHTKVWVFCRRQMHSDRCVGTNYNFPTHTNNLSAWWRIPTLTQSNIHYWIANPNQTKERKK